MTLDSLNRCNLWVGWLQGVHDELRRDRNSMSGKIEVRPLGESEASLLPEIDVSEQGSVIMQIVNGQLRTREETWARSRWEATTWQTHLQTWQKTLHIDLMLGAFGGERLVGMASLRYQLTPTMAQLTTLYVSQTHRRQGVAQQLVQAVCELAKRRGAQALYVSSVPSVPAVNFYLSRGFLPTADPFAAMYELEPDDIHMIRPL